MATSPMSTKANSAPCNYNLSRLPNYVKLSLLTLTTHINYVRLLPWMLTWPISKLKKRNTVTKFGQALMPLLCYASTTLRLNYHITLLDANAAICLAPLRKLEPSTLTAL